MAVFLFDSKRTQGIQASSHTRDLSDTVMDFDMAIIGETRASSPLVDDASRTLSLEIQVDVLELFEKLQQNLSSRLDAAGSYTQRRRTIRNIGWKRFVIHIQTHADDHILQPINLGLNLGQNSTNLLSADQKIVRPLDINIQSAIPLNRIMHGDSRTQGEQRRQTWRNFWKE